VPTLKIKQFVINVKSHSRFSEYSLLFALVALMGIFYLIEPRFLSKRNIFNIILQISIIAPLAIGQTLVILTGGIDLSVGSILAASSAIGAGLLLTDYNVLLCSIVAIAVGTGLGLFNGLTISFLKLPPLIATLGMLSIAKGLMLTYTLGATLYSFPKSFRYLGESLWFGIPAIIYLIIGIFIMFHLITKYTTLGRSIYAIGGNPIAAKVSGISLRKITLLVYTISGALAALGGLLLLIRMNAFSTSAGEGMELDTIAAVVIGGTSLTGGHGSIFMTATGCLIYGIILNGLNIIGVNPFIQRIVIGAIIIGAVAVDRVTRNKSEN